MAEIRDRFKDATWHRPDKFQDLSVVVGGSGGIGSWLMFMLARLGQMDFNIYDNDQIESHNLGGQLFNVHHIRQNKAQVISQLCSSFSDCDVQNYNIKIDENTPAFPVSFSAFDNMLARKTLFEKWASVDFPDDPEAIYIDGRLQAEQFQIFCVKHTPEDIERYRKYLFDDSKIEDAPCTLKQTSHVAAMIASHMTAFFTNHLANVYEGNTARAVPFFYEYYTPINMTNRNPD